MIGFGFEYTVCDFMWLEHTICGMTNGFFFFFPLFLSFSSPFTFLNYKNKAQVEAKKEHEGAVQLLEVRRSFVLPLQRFHSECDKFTISSLLKVSSNT